MGFQTQGLCENPGRDPGERDAGAFRAFKPRVPNRLSVQIKPEASGLPTGGAVWIRDRVGRRASQRFHSKNPTKCRCLLSGSVGENNNNNNNNKLTIDNTHCIKFRRKNKKEGKKTKKEQPEKSGYLITNRTNPTFRVFLRGFKCLKDT